MGQCCRRNAPGHYPVDKSRFLPLKWLTSSSSFLCWILQCILSELDATRIGFPNRLVYPPDNDYVPRRVKKNVSIFDFACSSLGRSGTLGALTAGVTRVLPNLHGGKPLNTSPESGILFYDGDCSLCNRSIQFILRHERGPSLQFSSLSSPQAQERLRQFEPLPDELILLQGGSCFTGAAAVWRVCRHLRFPWSLLSGLRFIPPALTNRLYTFVAQRRPRLNGKATHCPLPKDSHRDRFLDRGA